MLDAMTWQALGLTLSVVGLLASSLVWRRRGSAAGLRAVAWSLLPAAAGLTGVLRLLANLVGAVAGFATGLVFSPVVWVGVSLAVVSAVLFVVGGVLARRQPQRAAPQQARVGRERSRTPATGSPERAGSPGKAGLSKAGSPADSDLDDIEEILRRHGIS